MFSLGWFLICFARFNLIIIIIIIIIIISIIIIIICQFRLVSPRSYNVAFIPTLNKFHKQTKKQTKNLICAWKTYVVRGSDLTVDKVVITKNLEGCKNCECYVSKKIQEINIKFSNWSFFLFFSLCFFCVHYFSLAHFTILRAAKRQRTRINQHQISIKL